MRLWDRWASVAAAALAMSLGAPQIAQAQDRYSDSVQAGDPFANPEADDPFQEPYAEPDAAPEAYAQASEAPAPYAEPVAEPTFEAMSAADPTPFPESAAEEEAARRFSVTVTPRAQTLYFPNLYADKSGDFTVFQAQGATVSIGFTGSPFAITANMLSGHREGVSPDETFFVDQRVNRHDASLQLSYAPPDSNITFIGGVRQFIVKSTERRQLPVTSIDFSGGSYRDEYLVGEAGARIGGRLGAESRSALSAQMTLGVGRAETEEVRVVGTFAGPPRVERFSADGAGGILEAALAYNYFLSDKVSLGARVRSFTLYKGTAGDSGDTSDDISTAVAPELNLSLNF
jgi:hypothetical protein